MNEPKVAYHNKCVLFLLPVCFDVSYLRGSHLLSVGIKLRKQRMRWQLGSGTSFAGPFISPAVVRHPPSPLSGEVDKSVRCSCQIFSGFNVPKVVKIS